MKALFYFLLSVLLCGCSVIHSQEPMGHTPKDLTDEVDDWEGCWSFSEGTLQAFVINASNGVIRVVALEQNGDEIKQDEFDLTLRKAGSWTFASITDDDHDVDLYIWGRIKMEDGTLLAWAPDTKKFTTLIKNGTLPGTVDGSDGTLAPLSTNHYEIITNPDTILFEWDEPLVFKKIYP